MSLVSAWIALGRFSRIRPALPVTKVMISFISLSSVEGSLPKHVAGDDHAHDLVGPLQDRMDPEIAPEALDRIILQITIAAVKLERPVDHRASRIGRKP